MRLRSAARLLGSSAIGKPSFCLRHSVTRSAGRRSFPGKPPAGSACPASDPRYGLAQPAVLELKLLHALHLLDLQPAKLLTPAIVGHLAYANLPDGLRHA